MNIGFVGFGEVACCFSRGLAAFDDVNIMGFDLNYNSAMQRSQNIKNVEIVKSIPELLNKTRHIIVAVPGTSLEDAFENILKYNIENCLFMDFSTALPNVKIDISSKIYTQNALYVDVAVVGSVPKLLHKTPMLISGNGMSEMCFLFENYGMDLTKCGENAGKASTIKLCRSVFMKGLPALLIETQRVCKKYGVEKEVFSSIYKNLENQSFETFANRLIDGAYKHSVRQKAELKECLEMESLVGMDSFMTTGAIKIFKSLGHENE